MSVEALGKVAVDEAELGAGEFFDFEEGFEVGRSSLPALEVPPHVTVVAARIGR
jgi:hypothetical protein